MLEKIKKKIIQLIKLGKSDPEIFKEINKEGFRFNSMGEFRRIKNTLIKHENKEKNNT
jgi:hypothetical protein